MTGNRTFIRDQLEAAWQAKLRGDRRQAIKTLIRAIAEGDATSEENLRILIEEASRRRNHPRPHRSATYPQRRPST
jgi:hypothetical protein